MLPSFIDIWCRKFLLGMIQQLPRGALLMTENNQTIVEFNHDNSSVAEIHIQQPVFYRKILLGGGSALGESYVDGDWETPDLTQVIRLFARNLDWFGAFERRFVWLNQATWIKDKIQHWWRKNSKQQAKYNVFAHYDLGLVLYKHFLDPDLVYSSSVFPHPQASLAEAQQHKLHLLCEKMQLTADDHLLEIGCGWGALAIYAAKNYGCHVTTTTISDEQYDYVEQRVQASGLQNRITLLKQDYRDLRGQYDKVISVEVIEHIGQQYLAEFFRCCDRLLNAQGVMVLQGIVFANSYFDGYTRNVDFMQKYIFPGGFLPTLDLMCLHIRENTDLRVCSVEDFRVHYIKTLRLWWRNFNANQAILHQQGYDQRFRRSWQYYLNYSEAGFSECVISVVQLVAHKSSSQVIV